MGYFSNGLKILKREFRKFSANLAPLSGQHFLILDFQRRIDNDSLCKVFKGGVFFQMPIKNSPFSFKFRQFNLDPIEERLLSIPPTYGLPFTLVLSP